MLEQRMELWKKLLLNGYYYSTLPGRRLGLFRFRQTDSAPVIVLFYHRVADSFPNPWTMSCDKFSRQITWLKKHVDLISLEEVQHRLRQSRNNRTAVSITFDDGYAENCRYALPLLIHERIPCTYFVTANNVLQGTSFAHDIAVARPLPVNTIQQLQALANAGVEIGAHSRSHPDLGDVHDDRVLHDEIVSARNDLQNCLSRPIRYFAFPFGKHSNLNRAAFQMARNAGYQAVCSAYGGYNLPGDDPFHLQRIHGDPEFARFRNNLSDDPRQRFVKRFPNCEPTATERTTSEKKHDAETITSTCTG